MAVNLAIRCFTCAGFNHNHDFPQLVIALRGAAENYTDEGDGRIGPGQCIVFPAGCMHRCVPDANSCFLVVDLDELPPSLQDLPHPIVSMPEPLQAYCHFVEKQFAHQLNDALEQGIGELFLHLLHASEFPPRVDPRIARVIEHFEDDLSANTSLPELASISTLSVSQFKKIFKEETGKTPGQYLQMLRMTKSQALLAYTDYSLAMIAEMVGYADTSSFSRRFSLYHGHAPRNSRKQPKAFKTLK